MSLTRARAGEPVGVLLDGILGRFSGLPEKDVPPPPEWLARYLHFMVSDYVERFRDRLPSGVSFRITSGFRDPARNERVGGAANSAHIHGLAVDVVANSATGARIISELWRREFGGVAIIESDHVHLNLPRAWGWKVIRALAVVLVLAAALLLLLFVGVLDGEGKEKRG